MLRYTLIPVVALVTFATGRSLTASMRAEQPFRAGATNHGDVVPRQGWVVSREPDLRLGGADAKPAEEFSRIRGVTRLSDGRIVVADGTSQEIRFFDRSGAFLSKVGRSGSGPGEFGVLWSLARAPGDSVLAWDSRLRRLSTFIADGRLARELDLRNRLPSGTSSLLGRFADGGLLFQMESDPVPARAGIHRSRVVYLRVGPTDSRVDTLAEALGHEVDVVMGQPPAERGWTTYEIPYSRASYGAVSRRSFYVGQNDRFEIDHRDMNGRLLTRIRHTEAERPVSDAEVTRLEQDVVAHISPSARRRTNIQRLFHAVPRPPLRPAYSALIADAVGNVWVAEWVSEFAPPSRTPVRWFVFNADGRPLATVSMPAGLTPREIGRDYILGVSRDELDVERVDLYRLRR